MKLRCGIPSGLTKMLLIQFHTIQKNKNMSRKPFTIIAASPDHKIQVIISGITMSDPSGKGQS